MTLAAVTAAAPLRRGMKNGNVGLAQLALQKAGAVLEADGDFGAITETAVKHFQRTYGLADTGVIDAVTAAGLDALLPAAAPAPIAAPPSVLGIAPWLSVMRAITGTKEFAGSADNPVILGWVKTIVDAYPDLKGTVGWYNHDSIPWCGLGVGFTLARTGFKPPKMLLGAANYFNDWPDGHALKEPCQGAILVKSRVGGSHVTLIECEDEGYYYCRGANQSDMVNVSRIAKDETVKGFMWPNGGPTPGKRVYGTMASAVAGTEA
jgi:uncharacterized protein (TIGR02594 family)